MNFLWHTLCQECKYDQSFEFNEILYKKNMHFIWVFSQTCNVLLAHYVVFPASLWWRRMGGGVGGGGGGIKVVPESLRNSLTLPGWNKWRCLNKDTGTGKMNFQKHCLLQFTNRIKTQQKNTKVTFFAIWNSWPCFPTMLIINMNLSHWF